MITVYTKDNCSYCVKAKALLRSKDIKFNEVRIGIDMPRADVVTLFPAVRSVPIIVVEGVTIGGYEQLVTYLKEDVASEDDNLLLG